MPSFRTDFMGYSVKWSPYHENRLAVATAQHFGIIGNGRQFVLEITPQGIRPLATFLSQDGLFDCAFSEENQNHLVSASGDGSVKLWDINQPNMPPLSNFREHTKEVYSIDWNLLKKDTFITGSWDGTIKWWSPRQPQSLGTFAEHQAKVYAAMWSPHNPVSFASVSGDRLLKIWDVNTPRSVQTVLAHNHEILTCSWNKYKPNVIVTGSVDKSMKIWDLRRPDREVSMFAPHTYAVRRIVCSPHSEDIILSASYDMSVIVWSEKMGLVQRTQHHTEFALGCDFNMFIPGQIASCGWDCGVFTWMQGQPVVP
jgi:peroxin-7